MKLSLLDIANKFSNDEVARFWFRRALCKNSVTSPHWGSERFSERPRHDSPASHCTDCRKDFTSKSNTIMYTANIGNREQDSTMQCKCYAEVGAIKKKDIDPFFAKSAPKIFRRLMLVDTSSQDLGKNALPVLENADQDSNRIQLEELENSQIDWLPYVRENRLEFHAKKELRDHQIEALREVKEGSSKSDHEDESSFERIHSNDYVNGVKRLNMTATKRIYAENGENKVEGVTVKLVSMDDEKVYGDVLFHRGLGSAADNKLLSSPTQATQ